MRQITLILIAIITLFSQESADASSPTQSEATNMWAIDLTPLEVDGELYGIWSGWRDNFESCEDMVDHRGQHLFIAKMTLHDQKPLVRLGERVELCSFDTFKWENEVGHNIQEGAQILRNPKTDDIFVIYSVNGSWTERYKLGQIKLSKGCDPLDPRSWVKREKPVFKGVAPSDNLGYVVYGVGHASFTTSPDDSESWIFYHAKTAAKGGWGDRKPYMQRISFDRKGEPQMGRPEPLSNTLDRPSGEIEIDTKRFNIKQPQKSFANPVYGGEGLADPWIVKYDGVYYTVRINERRAWVTESPYMTRFVDKSGSEISYDEARVDVGWSPPAPSSGAWNPTQFWAPELHRIGDRWYIFYAAGVNTKGPYWSQRSGVLVSTTESVFGPYVEHDDKPLFTGEREYIKPLTNNSNEKR